MTQPGGCQLLKDYPAPRMPKVREAKSVNDLLPTARFLVRAPEWRRNKVGFVGYGNTKAGDRVLIAVDSLYDSPVVESIAKALREVGAVVDVLVRDNGSDREFDYSDEVRVIMRRKPWTEDPRRYEGVPWVEDLASKRNYNLLIHGVGGPIPKTQYRYEGIPWVSKEVFASPATIFPPEVNELINRKAWEVMYRRGRGGRVRLTDPEGTDISFTLWEEYYSGKEPEWKYAFGDVPLRGHLMGHPAPPLIEKADAKGVVAGTIGHYVRPFPHMKAFLDEGRVIAVEGGGKYGDHWREVLAETSNVKYPVFPRPGLLWFWEVAIGTNPKVRRPRNILRLSSGGGEYERYRSGYIHVGIGTLWGDGAERWAGENKILYGHLHVHLMFPTYEITTKDGEALKIIDKGHLTMLDDPEVRKVASKYGDPNELLREDWIPGIPGVNSPGDYMKDYGRDPVPWIKRELGIG